MRKSILTLLAFFMVLSSLAHADSAAPEMFGVHEIIINNAMIANPKAADTCGGVSREMVMETLIKAFGGANSVKNDVPIIPAADAKPPSLGVARIELTPEIYTRTNENLECVSFVTMAATSHANLVVPPVNTLRSVSILYWHQSAMASSGESMHPQVVNDLLQKMVSQFVQQYRLDQPPELK